MMADKSLAISARVKRSFDRTSRLPVWRSEEGERGLIKGLRRRTLLDQKV